MLTKDEVERDEQMQLICVRVRKTIADLREADWTGASCILVDGVAAARWRKIDLLALTIEKGAAMEAMARIAPYGDLEKRLVDATGMNVRVIRRCRFMARYIIDHPDALPVVLAAGSVRAAEKLVRMLRAAERPVEPPPEPPAVAVAEPRGLSFEGAVALLRTRVPALAARAAMSMKAQAAFAAEITEMQEQTAPVIWTEIEEALEMVQSAASEHGAEVVAGLLMGGSPRPAPVRLADGSVRVPGWDPAERPRLRARISALMHPRRRDESPAVIAAGLMALNAAQADLLAVAGPAAEDVMVDLAVTASAVRGGKELDVMIVHPFVVLFGEGPDDLSSSAMSPEVLRTSVVEFRGARRRIMVAAPTSDALRIMRAAGVRPSACGGELSGTVLRMMRLMAGVDDERMARFLEALSERDWNLAMNVVPRAQQMSWRPGRADDEEGSDSRVRSGERLATTGPSAEGRC